MWSKRRMSMKELQQGARLKKNKEEIRRNKNKREN